jgi:hypothetical protein
MDNCKEKSSRRSNANGETVRLPITISFLESGSARVVIDEEKRLKGEIELRHDSKIRKERYNEAESWAIVGGLDLSKTATEDRGSAKSHVKYGPDGKFEAVITYAPFGIDFKRDDATQIKFNDRGLLNVEHWRPKIDKPVPEVKEGEEAPATPQRFQLVRMRAHGGTNHLVATPTRSPEDPRVLALISHSQDTNMFLVFLSMLDHFH